MCTRRHFLKLAAGGAFLGPLLLERAAFAAAQARAAASVSPGVPGIFDIEKVADGVYAAIARPRLPLNCNACIIVDDDGVMVVDSHSSPAAARALIAQIRQITPKPVRYLVNTHFHGDHVQGNHAYVESFPGVQIYSSTATRDLIHDTEQARLNQSIESTRKDVEELRASLEKEADARQRANIEDLIAQGEAYVKEAPSITVDLPVKIFSDTAVIRGKNREIQMMLFGRGHTSGDVVVYVIRERVIATGDLVHGFLPYIGDGYPLEWPVTLDNLARMDFTRVAPGHGSVQQGKQTLYNFRNYIDELNRRVSAGIRAGRTVEQLQSELTIKTLKSLRASGYLQALDRDYQRSAVAIPGSAASHVEANVRGNVADVYNKLKAAGV